MESEATPNFWRCLKKADPSVRNAAVKAYKQFRENPWDPELKFKHMKGDLWSARIPDAPGWRVLGLRDGDLIVWDYMGDHDSYMTRSNQAKGKIPGKHR